MKYVNGKDILPYELLKLVQDYAEGQYVYIPKKEESKAKWGDKTSYRKELYLRNSHIYTKFLTGLSVKQLVEKYNLSQKSIKRILYYKRKEAGKMKKEIEELLYLWGIKADIQQIYDRTWAVGDKYVIKSNKNPASLKRNIEIMRALNECGIPVAKPIPTIDGQNYVECNEKYYLLMNKLSGTHILDIYKEDYLNITYETGRITAKLHTAFIACEQKLTFWNNSLVDEMNGWISDIFRSNQYKFITKSDFETSLNELMACYDKLPRQLIHRDFHYGNILFNDGAFSGYIDFDLSQKNVRIFDICYFLMGLLVEHYKNEDDVDKWYKIISSFINGYEDIIQLTKLEKDSMCCLMKNIELLFVSYFISKEDEALAAGSADLYYFVKNNENKILSAVYHTIDVCQNKSSEAVL